MCQSAHVSGTDCGRGRLCHLQGQRMGRKPGESMSKYSVLVVGMGKRGMHHATAFNANPRFQVAGICDIDQGRLEAAAAKLGNPQKSSDAAALAKAVKPDVFCFCTLPNLRMPMIDAALESGAKLIAFEKPVAL